MNSIQNCILPDWPSWGVQGKSTDLLCCLVFVGKNDSNIHSDDFIVAEMYTWVVVWFFKVCHQFHLRCVCVNICWFSLQVLIKKSYDRTKRQHRRNWKLKELERDREGMDTDDERFVVCHEAFQSFLPRILCQV